MTPGMQLRLWTRNASRGERALTYGVIALVACMLVASVALAPEPESAGEVALDALGQPLAPDGTPLASGAAEPVASPDGVASDGTAAAPVDGGAIDPSSPAIEGGSSATPGGSAPGEPLNASDRGVTATEIKLGFMLQNTAGLNSSGFSTGQRTDGKQYIQALVDHANKNGGVAGRKLVAFTRFTDPTSTEDAAAACQAMVSDAKVFGVVDVASIIDTGGQDCLTNRGDTPYVHSVLWSTEWQKRSRGNEVSYQAAIDRISVTWARDLKAVGWLKPGAVLGILGDKCPATEPTINNVLKPALEKAGASKVVVGNHDCDISSVASQPGNIATQFRLAGVTGVLIVSNFVSGQVFVSAAKSQGFNPEYSVSDWFLLSADPTTANYDKSSFDGAIGISSLGGMLPQSGKPPYPGWERCSQIAVAAGLPKIDHKSESAELLSLCDNFFLMLDALAGAGRNPTRASWREAVTRLADRTSAVFGASRFAPGKTSGSDQVHTIRWERGCACWKSISDFRPAAA